MSAVSTAASTTTSSTAPPAASLSSSSVITSPMGDWVVHKFGGTSLATSECYANSAEIIRNIPCTAEATTGGTPTNLRKCIVVSAMGEVKADGSLVARLIRERSPNKVVTKFDKVTNYLIKCTQLAASNDSTYLQLLESLKQRHIQVVTELLNTNTPGCQSLLSTVLSSLESDFDDLSYILRAVWLSKTYDLEHNWWFGFGEIWSARLMNAYLNLLDQLEREKNPNSVHQSALYVDAREIIQLTQHKDPTPNYVASKSKLAAWLSSPAAQEARIIVVTGYIATTASGTPTTLGRDGSDYSASIFGALLQARSVTIWTDVDGVYSANPVQVRSAVILPELSYDEASELAYFGAKVLHPKTMTPVVLHNIPVWIRNTFNHTHPGSCIVSGETITSHERALKAALKKSPSMDTVVGYGVRGFSEISHLSLLIVEGTGMIGVPGVCARLFGALRNSGVSVVLITQAGSEHSICLCLPSIHGPLGLEVIRREFRDELATGEIQTVDLRTGVACLAIVGDGMRSRRGAAARMFAALADAGINIMAIAQGSSERNISVIISQDEVATGLKAVHAAFLATAIDKEYSPLLTPSSSPTLDEIEELNNLSLPPTVQPITTNGNANSAYLDRLFPLPILATLNSIQARGSHIQQISLVLPTAISDSLVKYTSGGPLNNWRSMTQSQLILGEMLIELAQAIQPQPFTLEQVQIQPPNLTQAKTERECIDLIASAPSTLTTSLIATTYRLIGLFRAPITPNPSVTTSSTTTISTGGSAEVIHTRPTLSIELKADCDCGPHGQLTPNDVSILIWTSEQSDQPIRLQASIPTNKIHPNQ